MIDLFITFSPIVSPTSKMERTLINCMCRNCRHRWTSPSSGNKKSCPKCKSLAVTVRYIYSFDFFANKLILQMWFHNRLNRFRTSTVSKWHNILHLKWVFHQNDCIAIILVRLKLSNKSVERINPSKQFICCKSIVIFINFRENLDYKNVWSVFK